MRRQRFSAMLTVVLTIILLSLASTAWAARYKALYKFRIQDAWYPESGVVLDAAGNIYGTTQGGGVYMGGRVFRLTPNPDGTWSESVLHEFGGNIDDGNMPKSGLIFDSAGNLYGMTRYGGSSQSKDYSGSVVGCGTVFKLTPNPDGSWTESVVYRFANTPDGRSPAGNLIFDAAGSLYGVTETGGNLNCNKPYGCGTVFKLSPNPDGSWTHTVLHVFAARDPYPVAGLTFDQAGNLYGTTCGSNGTLFQLTPNPDGSWTENVIHRFKGKDDGARPCGSLSWDTAGNLYGTTKWGGRGRHGVVFRFEPMPDGSWQERIIHAFQGELASRPFGNVVFDAAGNLYGTTYDGGNGPCYRGCGTAYKLTPIPDETWKIHILHSFQGWDGANPMAGMTIDAAGNLYGTTRSKGHGKGVVFRIKP